MEAVTMGRVIQLETRKNVDQDLVALLEEMLASARRGDGVGAAGMFEMSNGKLRVFSKGTFAQDDTRTAKAGSQAVEALCQRAGIPHPKLNAMCKLPPRLLKA